jgi:hypothetical protein
MNASNESATSTPPSLASDASAPLSLVVPKHRHRNWLGLIALVVAIVSLAANAALIYALLRVGELGLNAVTRARSAAVDTINDGLNFVEDLQAQGVSFNFPISQTIRVNQEIPISATVTVPIKANIPLRTTITLSINLGPLGTREETLPINAVVPVDVSVPVQVNEKFSVDVPLAVRLTLPIRFEGDEEPMRSWLGLAHDQLTAAYNRIESLFQSLERVLPQGVFP